MMICHRIICFVAITFMATATCNAQHVTYGDACQTCASGDCHNHAGCSGCGGVGCAIFKCQGHAYFPGGDSCCPKPWTYDQASALWGAYCHQRGCGRGCLSGCNGLRGNAGLCHPAGSTCGGACSTGTCCGTCGSSLQTGCSPNCTSHVGHQGIFNNMFRRHGNVHCDSTCDNGALQPQQARSGTRHGMNLFGALKSRSNPCSQCSSGCDAVVNPHCGCDQHGTAAPTSQSSAQMINRVKTSYPQ